MKILRSCAILLCALTLAGCYANKNSESDSSMASTSEHSAENESKSESVLFKGTEKDPNAISTVNYKQCKPMLFCSGGEEVYFSFDGAVYSYDGVKENKLFEGNAYCLNYFNGSIYYIINNSYVLSRRDLVTISGIPYKYEISSGKITQLSDTPVANMVVLDDGIYWTHCVYADDPDATAPTGICRLDEETGQSERLYNGFSYIEYNGLRLTFEVTNDGLQYMFFDDSGEYLLDGVNPWTDCISGDNYYYISMKDGTLNRISMLTGEKTACVRYSDDMLPENSEKLFSYSDYTVLNDEIIFSDSSLTLCHYDSSTQTINEYSGDNGFLYLYTDGEYIYSVVRSNNETDQELHFAKVILDGNKATVDIII